MDQIPINQTLIRNILSDAPGPGPLTATFAITSHCNLGCEFCWCNSPFNKKHPRLCHAPTKRIIADINNLAKMGTKEIILSAKGEAACHPDFFQIVNVIKDAGLFLTLLTNFSIHSPKHIAAYSRADHIMINLGAFDERSYQDIHAPVSSKIYYDLLENIKCIVSLSAKSGHPIIEICYIITKNNFRHIGKAIQLARSLEIPSIRFVSMQTTPYTQKLSLSARERRQLFHDMAKLLQHPLNIRTNLKRIVNESFSAKNTSAPFAKCFIGWLDIYIELDGSVWSCCQNSSFKIGDCRKNTLQEIWNGPKAQRFRLLARDHMHQKKYFGKDCRYCRQAEINNKIENLIKIYNARRKKTSAL